MPIKITFDVSQIKKFEKKTLQKIKSSAFPLAVKNTLNTMAFTTMKKARLTIQEDFINRNKFTERSIRVDKVMTLKITDMVATVGNTAPYMLAQEEGETRTSKGRHGLRIPTGAAAGQSQLFPRRKVIKKSFRRGQLKLANSGNRINAGAKNRRRFILMSIRIAALRGQSPFVFLPFGGRKAGIYKVIPKGSPPPTRYKRGSKKFSRKNKWGRPKGKPGMEKLIFIHNFSHRNIKIRPTRWLSSNAEKVGAKTADIFIKEADRAFDRLVKK
jgi:hypothetical protein